MKNKEQLYILAHNIDPFKLHDEWANEKMRCTL